MLHSNPAPEKIQFCKNGWPRLRRRERGVAQDGENGGKKCPAPLVTEEEECMEVGLTQEYEIEVSPKISAS
jgi:hypothetical protein